MKKRQIIIVGAMAFLVASFLLFNKIAGTSETSARKQERGSLRSVTVEAIKNDTLRAKIGVTGKISAREKVDIFAEVNGVLTNSSADFREGNTFSKGQVLLRIDDTEMRLNIKAARSAFLSLLTRIMPDLKLDFSENAEQWDNYIKQFNIDATLNPLPEPGTPKEKYFLSTQGVFNQYYTIKSQEARLSKYEIRAPFNGSVSASNVNPGTLIRAGQPLGSFVSSGRFEMPVSISLVELDFIQQGSKALLKRGSREIKAEVLRISDQLDQTTQSVKVILGVSAANLKDGEYLSGYIIGHPMPDVYPINRNLFMEDSTVFVVKNDVLKKQKVHPVLELDDKLFVRNLKDGQFLLESNFPGAFSGMKVQTAK